MLEITREEKLFPEDLEGRLTSVLNGINIELKTATLLHLDDRPADNKEIKARLRQTVGKEYLPDTRVFGGYGNTLQDIALVAKETIVKRTGEIAYVGYSLTEAGTRYGLPIAEHVLKWAVDNDLSMFSILGSTFSTGKTRAPYNRVRVLEALSAERINREGLAEHLSLSVTVTGSCLRALSKIGFVRFESIGTMQKGYSKYRWSGKLSPESVKLMWGHSTLTREVIELMVSGKEMDYNDVVNILKSSVNSTIGVLSWLEKQGVLDRTVPWRGCNYRSEAEILNPGRKFLEEVLQPITEHLSDKHALTTSLNADFSDYITQGIKVYAKVSPAINKKSFNQRIEELQAYLKKNPNATREEIAEATSQSETSVGRYLRILGNKIKVEKIDHEVRYSLVSAD